MNYRFKVFAGLVATGGIIGLSWLPINKKLSARSPEIKPSREIKASFINQAIPEKKAYSSYLVNPYTKRCSQKLQTKGISSDIATQICGCSLEQMQAKHTQKQAIAILIKASKSKVEDATTGMPAPLSGYFTPCMLGASN